MGSAASLQEVYLGSTLKTIVGYGREVRHLEDESCAWKPRKQKRSTAALSEHVPEALSSSLDSAFSAAMCLHACYVLMKQLSNSPLNIMHEAVHGNVTNKNQWLRTVSEDVLLRSRLPYSRKRCVTRMSRTLP